MPATAMLETGALRRGGLYGGELQRPLPPIAQRAIGIVGTYVAKLQEVEEVVALAKKQLKPTLVTVRSFEKVN